MLIIQFDDDPADVFNDVKAVLFSLFKWHRFNDDFIDCSVYLFDLFLNVKFCLGIQEDLVDRRLVPSEIIINKLLQGSASRIQFGT